MNLNLGESSVCSNLAREKEPDGDLFRGCNARRQMLNVLNSVT